MKRIILRENYIPQKKSFEKDVDWIFDSLGLSTGRDIENTGLKIFKKIITSLKNGKEITSEDLSQEMDVSRGTVNHHLRIFIDSGIIVREKRVIRLRECSLLRTIEQVRRDSERIFSDLINIAKDLDRQVGFQNR